MDYERAYKEAESWMRDLYPTLTGSMKEDAEHYFPELKKREDERIRKILVGMVNNQTGEWKDKDKILAYLEKQKEPLTPEEKMNHPLYLEGFDVGKKVGEVLKEQKPAEWSEEDEDCRDEICRIINNFADSPEQNRKLTDWLISLCPQPHWKPSEEQIRSLEYAIDYFKKKKNDTTYLESLLNDLKKL